MTESNPSVTAEADAGNASAPSRPFPTQRFTWNDLVRIIQVEQDLSKLRRSQQDQEYYDSYMAKVRAEYKTVLDYILATKLDVPTQRDPDSGKLCAQRMVGEQSPSQCQQRLVRNDFPYYFETDVEHWILWKWGGGDISNAELEEAKQKLRQDFPNVVDDMHWKNPPALQSIPEMDHVHILLRRPTETGHVNT